jgi:FkbM family methyltransferase
MKLINFFKKWLTSHAIIHRYVSCFYHESRFILSYYLILKYPDLKLIRYSKFFLENLRASGFMSQFGQDYFLFSEFFSSKKSGFFLDIGCNQPIFLNNTYFFEKKAGWSGMAFDPIAKYENEWSSSRKVDFVNMALGSESGYLNFIEVNNYDGWGNMLSSFESNAKNLDLSKGYKLYKVKVIALSEALENCNANEIDFVSIDVEGSEIEVLKGFDFSERAPKIILIENKFGLFGNSMIRDFLEPVGYKFYARIWTSDDVFIRL